MAGLAAIAPAALAGAAAQAMPLDLVAPGSAAVLVLFGARVGGLVLVAPVFSAKTVPVKVRTALTVLLAVVMQPAALAHAVAAPRITPAAVLVESLIGFAIGMGAAILVGAAEAAGEVLAMQTGLSGAAVLDPLSQINTPVMGQLMHLFALAVLLTLDLHHVMLDALGESARALPVGGPVHAARGLAAMASLGTTLFALGFRFAAPVIAAVLLANVALGVLSRAAPQLNVLAVAFPLQITLGLATLIASVPLVATWLTGWQLTYAGMLRTIFGAFAVGGGH
jgi:flagellar biosynthetic protein FliR